MILRHLSYACFLAAAASQAAAAYPERPIRIVTPFQAGSTTDVIARSLGTRFTQAWGQPVVVDSRPGAGGNIAADMVAKSPPDGHTLFLGATGPSAVNASLMGKLPYDPLRDFAPISLTATSHFLLVVHPSLPVKSVKELIALAKAKPGQLNYGSGGNGSVPHLAGELFKYLTGVRMNHIPYKGAEYMIDLLAGRIDLIFASIISSQPHIGAGRLRLLAVSADRRDPARAEVPTVSEAGVPGYDVRSWYGLLAAAGTPAAVVSQLNAEIVRTLALPETKTYFSNNGLNAVSSSAAEFSAYIRSEHDKWAKVVKSSGMHAD